MLNKDPIFAGFKVIDNYKCRLDKRDRSWDKLAYFRKLAAFHKDLET